ncbi:hypothetical protein Tco_1043120, partial [Tanacetum coccineum]
AIGWIPDFEEDDEEASRSDDQRSNDGNIDENSGMHKCSNMDGESDIKEVAETTFEKEQSSGNVKEDYVGEQKDTRSEDPFKIYELLNKNKEKNNGDYNSDDSLKYPPGYTLVFDTHT